MWFVCPAQWAIASLFLVLNLIYLGKACALHFTVGTSVLYCLELSTSLLSLWRSSRLKLLPWYLYPESSSGTSHPGGTLEFSMCKHQPDGLPSLGPDLLFYSPLLQFLNSHSVFWPFWTPFGSSNKSCSLSPPLISTHGSLCLEHSWPHFTRWILPHPSGL